MANILVYVGFLYMTIHLSKWAFTKGEKVRNDWENAIVPQLQNTFLGSTYQRLYFAKLTLLGAFNTKQRLIKKELKKPYAELFSEQLIDLMVEKRYMQEVYAEVNKITLMKERIEYQKFNFNDSIEISRRLQFFEIKETLQSGAEKNVLRIVNKMFNQNMLMPEEREIWKNNLKSENILDSNEQETGLDLVSKHEMEQVNNSVVSEEPVEIVTRTVNVGKRKRF